MFTDEEVAVFMEELEEKLQVINDNVLVLEREGESPAVIQEIFRAAHTIKGSSAVMGYEKMSALTHEIENLFDRLRQGTMQVSGQLVDTLFDALDTLKLLKDEITGQAADVDVAGVVARIRACQLSCDAPPAGAAGAAGGGASPAQADAGGAARVPGGDELQRLLAAGLEAAGHAGGGGEGASADGAGVRERGGMPATAGDGGIFTGTGAAGMAADGRAGLSGSVDPVRTPGTGPDAGTTGASAGTRPAGEAGDNRVTGTPPAAEAGRNASAPGAAPPYRTSLPLEEAAEAVVREAEVRGYQAYWLDIGIDRGCQMKSVRAFLIFETLQQIGEIIKSAPPAEELQEGRYGPGFTVLLITKEDPGQVHDLVYSIAEVSSVEVRPVQPGAAPANGRPAAAAAAVGGRAAAKTAPAAAPAANGGVKTVRVDVQKLDTLMNLVGELVIDRTRLDRFVDIFEGKYGSDDLADNIVEISNHLGQVTNDLQEEIMKARMLPVATVFNRLPRMVRDLAHKMGKEIDFVIEGRETELDRNVIEVIGDPLIHLLRNAVDHGIEPPEERLRLGKPRAGRVLLKAAYVESHIVITLSDDGKGMEPARIRQKAVEKGLLTPEQAARAGDREILDLIFTPGFSTARQVSDISGRGVGMDIVRSQIEQINGSVEFTTAPGKGATFTIKLPLTLAIIRALMVALGEQVYAFPLANVVETLALKTEEIRRVRRAEAIVVRGRVLPLVRLTRLFREKGREEGRLSVVILGSAEKKVGVVVDRLIGEQEIVIKSLGGYLGQVPGLSGATILGDGRVALIVDARGIVKETGVEETVYEVNRAM
ncbi:chemotaxis protein CheA [Desulfotomaculum copahuensis]|uniref:chemotaxis protein CheA n=1 Tax=Desulfotomaculum copahuensis TaxID=1838280 RepID=UPI00098F3D00|nr:chemotaxis protein CheA [Desulfotomaculum copahuensis]